MTKPIVASPTTLAKLARVKTEWIGTTLIIGSASVTGSFHLVTADGCDCPQAKYRLTCWHQSARAHLLAEQAARDVVIGGPQTPEELDALEDARQLRDALAELDAAPKPRKSFDDPEYLALLDSVDEITSKPVRRQRKVEAF